MFKYVYRYKTLLVTGILSFILGCTITLTFVTIDIKPSYTEETEVIAQKSLFQSINGNQQDVFLVILILSSPTQEIRRSVVRETWLLLCKDISVKYFFVIGSTNLPQEHLSNIENERNTYNDILLLENVIDSYNTLTKKVLLALSWIDTNMRFKYVLKCDDDSFVRVKDVVAELKTISAEDNGNRLYWGFFNGRASIKHQGNWKESDWILCDFYLPYALGGGYVLSHELVSFIARNAEELVLFNSEDVSVGVWLANLKNVKRHHDPRFDTEYRSRGCSNTYLVTHKRSKLDLKKLYKNLQTRGKLCEIEYKSRLSYIYNWSLPPSQCCVRWDENIP